MMYSLIKIHEGQEVQNSGSLFVREMRGFFYED